MEFESLKIPIIVSLLSFSLMANMSIEDAWLSTKTHNNTIKASDDEISSAKLKQSSAKGMYLPSVTLTGSYTHLNEPVKIEGNIDLGALPIPLPGAIPFEFDLSKQDVFLADLHLLWPLYTGGKIDAAQDIYAAQLSESKALAQMKKDVEFLKLVKYYYGVVVAESLYKTRLEAQKGLELHFSNAQKLKKHGQIAQIELLNAEVKLDASKIEVTKAKHKFEIASSALASITSSAKKPISQLFIVEDMKEENYYKDQTQQNYAGLKVLDAKEKQSASLVAIKESSWHPEIAAFANYNLYKDDSPVMETLPTWFAGVMIKIDLIKRRDRSEEIQAAELVHSRVEHLKAQAVEDLAILVEKTYKEMMAAREEYEALGSTVSLSKENHKLRSIAFKEGLTTSVALVDAQMFLMGAKTKRLNAAYTFVQKLAQLSVLSGDREIFFALEKNAQEIE